MKPKLLLLILLQLALSSAQIAKQVVECCGMRLQDSNGRVAIESTRPLSAGTYTALLVRLCSDEPFYVQIWTQLSTNSFRLKWQINLTPTINQTFYGPTLVQFNNYPLDINAGDRLGLYLHSTQLNKFPVPYSIESDGSFSPGLFLSDASTSFSQPPTPGLVIQLAPQIWPKTFAPYLSFCVTSTSCSNLTGNSNPTVLPSYLPYVSVPSSCCDKSIPCDANNNLGSQISNQTNQINLLTQTIVNLQLIINSLLNSTVNTGWCPQGFTPGFYGIGHCYKVIYKKLQLAEAAVSCNSFDRSRVLFLQSSLEDSFVYNLLQNNQTAVQSGPQVRFWTSALYNVANQNWYWYNYLLMRNEVFGNYRRWKNKEEPAPDSKDDVCATFTLDKQTSEYYWEKANCSEPNYYICKLPKKCL